VTRSLFKPSPEVLIRLAPHQEVEPEKMFEEAGWLKPKRARKPKKGGK
jgi:hypothetical protein